MPMLIEHIDAIARKKGRGVLFVSFEPEMPDSSKSEIDGNFLPWLDQDWDNHSVRKKVIKWLDKSGIEWQPCGHFAKPGVMLPYMGRIYIDVPYDATLPEYRKLEAFLENSDGSMRLPGMNFYYCPLEVAMKNAEHDEPGFWDKFAESW